MFARSRIGLLLLLSVCAFAQANPPNVEELVNRAAAARQQNDIPAAIDLYQKIVKLDPQWPDAWWFLGSLRYGTGEYDGARDALSHYIELAPNAGPARAVRGLCEFEIGDYASSLKDIQDGLAMGAANQARNEEILRYHEALLLTRLERFDDALRTFTRFTHEAAPNPELLVAIGLAGLRTPLLPKELKSNQQEVYASVGKAAYDFMKGDQGGASAEFQALFQRPTVPPNAHYLYGYLLYASDPDQALSEFQQELRTNPSSGATEVMLAWILLQQDTASEALPHAQNAVGREPRSAGAQLVLGRALTATGDVKAGIEHLEKAMQIDPNNLEVHIALTKAYSETGRKDDARRERLLCLEMTKHDTPLATHP